MRSGDYSNLFINLPLRLYEAWTFFIPSRPRRIATRVGQYFPYKSNLNLYTFKSQDRFSGKNDVTSDKVSFRSEISNLDQHMPISSISIQ